jgi:hypothetical protein
MQVQMKKVRSSLIVGAAAFMAVAAGLACSESSFQPITEGARPWEPPSGWNEPPCSTGYYAVVIPDPRSCQGCTGEISYALCVGTSFTQCTCGGPYWPGAVCPKTYTCSGNDFPPFNWIQFPD